MGRLLRVFVCCAVFLATACVQRTETVRSSVSAFSEMQELETGQTFFVKAFDRKQQKSLEWQSYADQLAAKLTEAGYVRADAAKRADLIAYLGYDIDDGTKIKRTVTEPVYPRRPYGFGYRPYGFGYRPPGYWGRPYPYGYDYDRGFRFGADGVHWRTPSFDYWPSYAYRERTVTEVVFSRSLHIDLVDRASGERKWEMKLTSAGSCGRFAALAPVFFDAAFQKFPQDAGGTIELPLEGPC